MSPEGKPEYGRKPHNAVTLHVTYLTSLPSASRHFHSPRCASIAVLTTEGATKKHPVGSVLAGVLT